MRGDCPCRTLLAPNQVVYRNKLEPRPPSHSASGGGCGQFRNESRPVFSAGSCAPTASGEGHRPIFSQATCITAPSQTQSKVVLSKTLALALAKCRRSNRRPEQPRYIILERADYIGLIVRAETTWSSLSRPRGLTERVSFLWH